MNQPTEFCQVESLAGQFEKWADTVSDADEIEEWVFHNHSEAIVLKDKYFLLPFQIYLKTEVESI